MPTRRSITTNAVLMGLVQGDAVTLDIRGSSGFRFSGRRDRQDRVHHGPDHHPGLNSGNYALVQPTTTASIT